jgi:hypothetical protein
MSKALSFSVCMEMRADEEGYQNAHSTSDRSLWKYAHGMREIAVSMSTTLAIPQSQILFPRKPSRICRRCCSVEDISLRHMVLVLEWIMVIYRCKGKVGDSAVNAASMMDMVWVRSERRAARVDEAEYH